MRGLWMGATLGALALAGCSKPADNAASNVAAAPVSAPASPPAAEPAASGGPITLAQLPAPTAGRWSRASIQDGKPESPGSKCLDGKPIDPLDGMPMKCAKMDATRTPSGGFVVIADCSGNGVEAKLSLAGEGDFKKSFSTDATLSTSGGPGGDVSTKNHSVWTYAGPTCPS